MAGGEHLHAVRDEPAIQLLLTLPDEAVEERAKIHEGLDLLIARKLGPGPVDI